MKNIENFCSAEPKDVLNNYRKAIELAQKIIKEKNWRCNFDFWDYIEAKESDIYDLTKSQLKKFRNKVNKVLRKPGLRNINTLLWFVSKAIFKNSKAWNLKISEKEEKIQIARRRWKVARDISEQLLKEYKEEKGDFYKK